METERRRDLAELVDAVNCLKDNFEEARGEFHARFDRINGRLEVIEKWKAKDVDPTLKTIRKAMWTVSGAASVLALLAGMVVWIWLQDHSIVTQTSAAVKQSYEINARQDKEIDRLRDAKR